jgi:ABC-type uncharacterized transport system permease subunit
MALANSLAFLLYLGCSAMLIRRFVQQDQVHVTIAIPVGILTTLALLFHGTAIFFTMQQAGGWDVGLFSTVAIATWLMAFITFLSGAKFPVAHPGIVIYPLVALSLMLQVQVPEATVKPLSQPALEWHILLSLAAYSLFTLAALQAIVLAVQEQKLRQRHIAGLVRKLPPLQTMESTLFHLLSVGFLLLTIGLITGFMFLDDIMAQNLAHKTILSLIAWSVFATLLWGRRRYGWRGKTAVKWTLLGFTFLALAFIGSKLILEFLLERV